MKPDRIQRTRKAGSKLPPNTICCTRGTAFGNPFQIGKFCKIGAGKGIDPAAWMRTSREFATEEYTEVKDVATAVEMFREYRRRYPFSEQDIARLRAADHLACYCKPGQPCHVDVIIEILEGKI